MNESNGRGVADDILVAVGDGLEGFPEAITATFPDCFTASNPHLSGGLTGFQPCHTRNFLRPCAGLPPGSSSMAF